MDHTIDHPHVRASNTCPLCDGPKDVGLVACWPCYRAHGMRNGNPRAEHTIDQQEMLLTTYARSELRPVYVNLDAQGPTITTEPTRGTLNFSR